LFLAFHLFSPSVIPLTSPLPTQTHSTIWDSTQERLSSTLEGSRSLAAFLLTRASCRLRHPLATSLLVVWFLRRHSRSVGEHGTSRNQGQSDRTSPSSLSTTIPILPRSTQGIRSRLGLLMLEWLMPLTVPGELPVTGHLAPGTCSPAGGTQTRYPTARYNHLFFSIVQPDFPWLGD